MDSHSEGGDAKWLRDMGRWMDMTIAMNIDNDTDRCSGSFELAGLPYFPPC